MKPNYSLCLLTIDLTKGVDILNYEGLLKLFQTCEYPANFISDILKSSVIS